MITPAFRSMVSAAALAVALTTTLGACAAAPSQRAWDDVATAPEAHPVIRFDNDAQTYVDVYLVTPLREWRLGRVGPGARSTLRIPEAVLTETTGFVRLAVLAGEEISLQAARDPRAALTIPQPASELLTQRWSFWQRQLRAPELRSMRLDAARP